MSARDGQTRTNPRSGNGGRCPRQKCPSTFRPLTWLVAILVLAFAALFAPAFVTPAQAKVEVPKTEAVFKGAVEEARGHECAVSGGVGSHVILQLNDGVTIEVRPAWTELVKTYELSPSFSACGKAADHTFPRRQPGSDRRRDNDP